MAGLTGSLTIKVFAGAVVLSFPDCRKPLAVNVGTTAAPGLGYPNGTVTLAVTGGGLGTNTLTLGSVRARPMSHPDKSCCLGFRPAWSLLLNILPCGILAGPHAPWRYK